MPEGKFGFIPESEEPEADLALQFKPTPVHRPLHPMEELDRAAGAAGFSSREPSELAPDATPARRRRINREPATRALAIRMTEPQFRRFLSCADRHQLTYSETISHLLDIAGESD